MTMPFTRMLFGTFHLLLLAALLLLLLPLPRLTQAFQSLSVVTVPQGHRLSNSNRPFSASSSFSSSSLFSDKGTSAGAAAESSSSAYVPPPPATVNDDDEEEEDDEDDDELLGKVENLGRGSAKSKRGKRKTKKTSSSAVKVNLAPEEVFYEGPPAITETIAPTISILTVIGIVPAAAAWARQAWVRYKITTRRIRVTSGIGGKDMAEIVYPDIVELRTAKRLFGDGDLVAFLRDGAKFEMRNIPNFEETMEFILKQVSPDVAKAYREKGDVTTPRGE